jgi:membrane-associated HD superfamily phosphohydrolase
LEQDLQAVEQQAKSDQQRIEPVAITTEERNWLRGAGGTQLTAWGREVRQAQLRMLSQGLAAGVAEGQLLQAATLQLEPLAPLPRGLGARLLASSLQGHSNLRSDPGLSQRRIEALITQQGIPTIKVQQGDLITRQGDTISPQAFDVLDYFGLVNRRPRPLAAQHAEGRQERDALRSALGHLPRHAPRRTADAGRGRCIVRPAVLR